MKKKSKIIKRWKKIGRPKTIFKKFGKYVVKQGFELPKNKKKIDFYFVGQSNSSSIFAITKGGKVILTRQYRSNFNCVIDELPAGKIEERETPKQSIIREFGEETGYKVGKIIYLGFFPLSNPNSFSKLYCFLAFDCEKIANGQKLDECEDIDVVLMTPRQWLTKVISGKTSGFADPASIINTFWALYFLGKRNKK